MVRILILIIIAAIVLSLPYFLFKTIPFIKKMLFAAGSLAAAAAGLLLQLSYPFYMALLAIVAVALLASIVFMKLLEKEEAEKQRLLEERKTRRNSGEPERTPAINLQKDDTIEEKPSYDNTIDDNTIKETPTSQETAEENFIKPSFGMESIDPDREER